MALAFVAEVHGDNVSPATTLVLTVAIASGDMVVVCIGEALSTVLSVTDNGSNTYTQKASAVGVRQTEVWGCASATGSATSLTVTMNAGANFSVSVCRYTGSSGFGNTATATGTSTNPSVSLTIQDAGGMMFGGFSSNGGGVAGGTAQTGTIRNNMYANNQGTQYETSIDHTTGTCSFTCSSQDWQAAAVELRNQAGGASKVPQITNLFRQRRA